MFVCDAELFLEASVNANSAKTAINDCIRLLKEAEIPDNAYYSNCKTNLENSGIEALIEHIDMTRNDLVNLDQEFASKYSECGYELYALDTSKMDEEELAEYNVKMALYSREYHYVMLEMLEKLESSGTISSADAETLSQLRIIVAQYEITDKMSKLPMDSDEYIELFKQKADYDRNLISLQSNLTEDEKAKVLAEYEISFNVSMEFLEFNHNVSVKTDELQKMVKEGNGGTENYYLKENELYQLKIDFYSKYASALSDEELKMLDDFKKTQELNNLYIQREELNNNWVPFDGDDLDEEIFTLKKELNIATPSELEYLEMDGWDRALHNTGAFCLSFVEGVFNVEEAIIDGGAMLIGGAVELAGVVGWGDGDTQWVEDFVAIDFSGDAYQGAVLSTGLNQTIAYGGAHEIGTFAGEFVCIVALNALPGGAAVTSTLHGLKGMGAASENVLQNGGDFLTAFCFGGVTGLFDAFTAYQTYGKTSSKLSEKVGNGIVKIFNKIPGVKILSNGISKLYNKIATTGMKNYAKAVFKPSLVGKLAIGVSKSYLIELSTVIVDDDFDWKAANRTALQAACATTFNALVTSPLAERAKEKANSKIESANKEKARAENKIRRQQKKLDELKDEDFGLDDSDLRYSSPQNQVKIRRIQKALEKAKYNVEHAYDNVTLVDRIVTSNPNLLSRNFSKVGSKLVALFFKEEN